jgi:dolichol-phosphate mannosyltransferase
MARLGGCRVLPEVPVGHRPRASGRSKYGVGNRLWVGLLDTLAVGWLRRRRARPTVLLPAAPAPAPQMVR